MHDEIELAVVETELAAQRAKLIRNRNRLAADGVVALEVAKAADLAGEIARPRLAAAVAFPPGVPRKKNFAPLPPCARLDSGKAPAYFSATLALALGEC
ncbi:hypothetical protein DPM35_27465 [Mesorhizobium atlanticum]|uniref:Uncharacterized protein n=1 Tax=Mesorhizobium atlanticum TaxID=2233532 RepID=A0A330GIL8_9HYPH|nr:hypothetical protein DPM35_27465 [Mesorhizobium atlanticum]